MGGVGTTPGWAQAGHLQVCVPLHFGDMGLLRPLSEIATAAFLGSWAQVLPSVQELVGVPPILGADAFAFPTIARTQAAEQPCVSSRDARTRSRSISAQQPLSRRVSTANSVFSTE